MQSSLKTETHTVRVFSINCLGCRALEGEGLLVSRVCAPRAKEGEKEKERRKLNCRRDSLFLEGKEAASLGLGLSVCGQCVCP
jgi:hypothetical protein